MRFSNPATRGMLLLVTFVVILQHIFFSWALARFWLADRQYRTLKPRYYNVQVVTAEDYRNLADRSLPNVTLSDGTTHEKTMAWYELILPGYKPTADKAHYVLVTTLGTGHVLSYLEPTLLLMGTLALCGFGLAVWNLVLLNRESFPEDKENRSAEEAGNA